MWRTWRIHSLYAIFGWRCMLQTKNAADMPQW